MSKISEKDIQTYLESDGKRLEEKKNYYEGLDLATAIEYASIGKTPNGIMDSHQWRVGEVRGMEGAKALQERFKDISSSTTFDELYKVVEGVGNSIRGLGLLWMYDTALRIGFQKRIYPTEVYVQRGVIDGVRKDLEVTRRPPGRILSMSKFSKPLQALEPYKAENFLCIWGKGRLNHSSTGIC